MVAGIVALIVAGSWLLGDGGVADAGSHGGADETHVPARVARDAELGAGRSRSDAAPDVERSRLVGERVSWTVVRRLASGDPLDENVRLRVTTSGGSSADADGREVVLGAGEAVTDVESRSVGWQVFDSAIAADRMQVEVVLVPIRSFEIEGRVVDAAGVGVAGAELTVLASTTWEYVATAVGRTRDDGAFAFEWSGPAAEHVFVTASAEGWPPASWRLDTGDDARAGGFVTLVLTDGIGFTLRLRDETGDAIPGEPVSLQQVDLQGLHRTSMQFPGDLARQHGLCSARIETDAGGLARVGDWKSRSTRLWFGRGLTLLRTSAGTVIDETTIEFVPFDDAALDIVAERRPAPRAR